MWSIFFCIQRASSRQDSFFIQQMAELGRASSNLNPPLLFAPLHSFTVQCPAHMHGTQDTCWSSTHTLFKQLFCGSPQTSDIRSGAVVALGVDHGSYERFQGLWPRAWSEACCQTQSPTCDHGVLADTCYTWKHTLDWLWKVKNGKYLFNITILVTC